MKKFEFLEHTADIKFRVKGKNLNEIFENTALAISDILGKGKKIKSLKKKKIMIKASDDKNLLYRFIDELIYLADAEGFIVSKAKVNIKGRNLSAVISGDNAKNYKDLDHIKAATYAEMEIKKTRAGWEAQAVVDV